MPKIQKINVDFSSLAIEIWMLNFKTEPWWLNFKDFQWRNVVVISWNFQWKNAQLPLEKERKGKERLGESTSLGCLKKKRIL